MRRGEVQCGAVELGEELGEVKAECGEVKCGGDAMCGALRWGVANHCAVRWHDVR